MASTRNADVQLIIKARNEADRAIESVASALQGLYGDAEHADSGVAELGKTLAALDKAAATVIGSVDKAGSALDRQTANIAENRAALAALVAQQSEARQILAGFGDQANKAFVGPRTEGFTKTYAAVRAEADRLEAAIERTSSTIAKQESAVAGAQSSLLKLSLSSGAIAEAQTVAEARISLTTQALNEQASAAARVTEVQRRINALILVDKLSIRSTCRMLGISRQTVRKMVRQKQPGEYRRREQTTAMSAFQGLVLEMLHEDDRLPQRQRRSIATIYRGLQTNHGYTGSYGSVARYCRSVRVPLIQLALRISGEAARGDGTASGWRAVP